MNAAGKGHTSTVEMLLRHGASIEAKHNVRVCVFVYAVRVYVLRFVY